MSCWLPKELDPGCYKRAAEFTLENMITPSTTVVYLIAMGITAFIVKAMKEGSI